MTGDGTRVGVVHTGGLSAEQRAALTWLEGRSNQSTTLTFAALVDEGADVDVLWWHRDTPVEADTLPSGVADAVGAFLDAGGGLVLTLRAMAAVEPLGVDPVPPDAVGVESVTEPTGVLWRTLYDEHPAAAGFETLRVPVCDRGAVATARYERVLPARGEVLAGTVRGAHDVPTQVAVVSWSHCGGAVLGVGAPLAFDEPAAEHVANARETLTAGCLAAVADDERDPPARPKTAYEPCARASTTPLGRATTLRRRPTG
jgi:beta-fructofuranosidase